VVTTVTQVTANVINPQELVALQGHSARLPGCFSTSTSGRYRPFTKVMKNNRLRSKLKSGSAILVLLLFSGGSAFAQQFTLAAYHTENIEPAPPAPAIQPAQFPGATEGHKFFDRENKLLFAATTAAAAADFAVTYQNLQSGGKELNPVTRLFSGSTAGLAVNFAGETAGVVGLSYFFHKTGHHRLERLTPMVNVGASAVAVAYGLSHR